MGVNCGNRASWRISVALCCLLSTMSLAEGLTVDRATAGLPKVVEVKGTVEECGAGPDDEIKTPITIVLHRASNGRVLARYTIESGKTDAPYAFLAAPGQYFLGLETKADKTTVSNLVFTLKTHVVVVPVTTACQG